MAKKLAAVRMFSTLKWQMRVERMCAEELTLLNNVNAGMLKKLATVRMFFNVKVAEVREVVVS
ncbi:hypothetical protein ACYEXS_12465 [Paenibacillus sp. MAH-36]|uniref:Uncharacterized protein n=2 Tax=Paenibacillus TaxID=44249 RepID=A0ABU3RF07_9BACL|nr:hypothetical protein [Paenibacillus sp. PFR10]